ncbi:hypothetical protein M3Y99_00173600 [Aphelenchoides fujianensis]|nr:hypothetical protein M3Y99_00173600 [Aphelenchoides fujianensis]
MSVRLMPKRGSEDFLAHPQDGGAAAAAMLSAISAASEPKKPKLDAQLAALSAVFPAANASALLFGGLPTAPAISASSSAVPTAAESAANAAAVAANALLNYQPNAANSVLSPNDPSGNPLSKVVHLRNIPSDMSELELIHFCLPFGKVYNYLMLKGGKNQAFVEYEDESGAQAIVHIAHHYPMAIRGKTIFVQYSTHQELKTERKIGKNDLPLMAEQPAAASSLDATANWAKRARLTSTIVPTSVQQLLLAANSPLQRFNQLQTNAANLLGQSSATTPVSASQLDVSTQQQPNSVLRVIVDNLIYAVTLDILHSIFSRYGKILRIITFAKNHTFQALVQFSEANAAQNAKGALDGQNIFNGCCTLRIDYSKLATLSVRYNNDKSRDYTNPLLPSGELTCDQQLALAAQNPLGSLMPNVFSLPQTAGANGVATSFYGQPALSAAEQLANSTNAAAVQNAALAPFLGGLGGNLAALAAASNGVNALGATSSLNSAASTILQQQLGGLLAGAITPVVLVSNLDENKVSTDAIFTLFGVYGDVQRVKILFNKKDNALIQYAEPQQAQLAIQHLDKVRWHGKVIRVAPSKHTNVQMPKEDVQSNLTRDYQNSTLHRYKKPGSKNYLNIFPPSSTLHLSNIPPSITEDFLKAAFTEKGFKVVEFQFFQRDHKMALVQLEDVETAIEALIAMHNHKLADNAHLRVSLFEEGPQTLNTRLLSLFAWLSILTHNPRVAD